MIGSLELKSEVPGSLPFSGMNHLSEKPFRWLTRALAIDQHRA